MSCCQRISLIFWLSLNAEFVNCMQRRSCFAIYCSEKLNQNIKMEQHLKFMNQSAIPILIKAYPTTPLSGQSKSGATIPLRVFFPNLSPSINRENTFVQWDNGAECAQLLHPWTHRHAPSSGIGFPSKFRIS
jgi:hypothetical protein